MTSFDILIDRRSTNSLKWQRYGPDVLPLWVADMDFPSPQPVQAALRRAVEHGIFGYEFPTRELCESVASRMHRLYGWKVDADAVVATPGVIAGFTAAAQVVCAAGQGLLVQPPVYPPFITLPQNTSLVRVDAPLSRHTEGSLLDYGVDLQAFEQVARSSDPKIGMFLLCNPHNPVGRAFARHELTRMAEICIENDITICSDEIHNELLLAGTQHTPLASIDPQIAERTITLVAPSKTFNVPGLFCAFAIIPNRDLLKKYKQMVDRMAMHVNSLGLVAAQAAFSGDCDGWLNELRVYLTQNRDLVIDTVQNEMDGIKVTRPAATYLAWMDCTELVRSGRIEGSPSEFFLKQAGVALNDGREFGPGGEGHIRLNFGCPRKTLQEALERMKAAHVKLHR